MNELDRIEFDTTLEEIADVNMRLIRRTQTYRRGRLQYQVVFGVVVAGVVAVALRDRMPVTVVLVFSLAAGVVSGCLYRPWHERSMQQSYLRMLREMYGAVSTVGCTFEIREDVLWTKTGNTELSLAWSDLVAVNDAGDGIELWFNPGLAVARNRAFQTDADRRAFMQKAAARRSQRGNPA